MRVVYDRYYELLAFAAQRIGIKRFRADAQAIGQERDGQIVAVVVFDDFSETDCMMHLASDGSSRWMTRELLVRVYAYPFIQMGLRRVNVLVSPHNTRALRLNEKIGYVREGLHIGAASDGGDLISMAMLRRNCRWIPREHRHD